MKIRKMLGLAVAIAIAVPAAAQDMEWQKVVMDGSRTGVKAANAENVQEAMGKVVGNKYYAPNGRVFRGGSVAKVAKLMIDSQDSMAFVKEVVGYAPHKMVRYKPECELSNWAADIIKAAVEKETGKKVDIAITNFGGIRIDMPEGDIILDDIMSMFPFKNYLSYVALRGSDVRNLFEILARKNMEAVSGVQVTIQDRRLVDIKVGGEPLDNNKIYGLATIDFLLNGGDDIFATKNAEELIITDKLVYDGIIEYVRKVKAEGGYIEAKKDGRVNVLPSKKK